jgi:4-hydroxy-tetrahydrodipicolinate synthase
MRSSAERVQERLRGVAVGLLTPFDDDLAVEYDKLADNATSLYDQGIRTFLSPANISEYHSLSREERIESARATVGALPDDACVLAGVGGSTSEACDLVRAYARDGVDAMMIMPPDHTYVHEQGLLDYYREIAAASEQPLVPYVRGYDPSVDFLAEMTHIDEVVGIKYALPDSVKLGAGVAAGSDDVVWVDGLAEPYAPAFWAEGIEGFSAGVSNFRPEVGLAMYDALVEEDWEHARELRNACLPYQRLRDETGQNNTLSGAISVPVVKKGLDMAGLHGGTNVREPIRPLGEAESARAEELYADLDAELDRLLG